MSLLQAPVASVPMMAAPSYVPVAAGVPLAMPALGVPPAAQALAPLMPSAAPPGASCQSPLGGMRGSPAAHLAALKAFPEAGLRSQLHSMEENRKTGQAQPRRRGAGQADRAAPAPSA